MSKLDALVELLGDEEVLLADGFEGALIGIVRQFGKPMAVYDRTQCIECLIDQGVEPDEAEEYFQFNVEGAWVGDQAPCFLEKI